jgi:thymidylate synthase
VILLTNNETTNPVGDVLYAKTANEAWQIWFDHLCEQAQKGKQEESRDGDIVGELINAVTVIEDPTRNIINSPDRKLPMRYAVGEFLWYLSGSNKVKDISQFSKVWEGLSDNGKTVNSAYGHRISYKYGFNQINFVLRELGENPNSRRAVVHIKDPRDYTAYPSKDVPCTVCLQYLIRDGKLHATTYMRSNDIWMGFPYDVFSFTCFQILLAMKLGVEVGTYTHIAGSLHLYKRDYDKWYRDIIGEPGCDT